MTSVTWKYEFKWAFPYKWHERCINGRENEKLWAMDSFPCKNLRQNRNIPSWSHAAPLSSSRQVHFNLVKTNLGNDHCQIRWRQKWYKEYQITLEHNFTPFSMSIRAGAVPSVYSAPGIWPTLKWSPNVPLFTSQILFPHRVCNFDHGGTVLAGS